MKYNIDYNGLSKFLKELTYHDIKEGALVVGHARTYLNLYYTTSEEINKVDPSHIIEYGVPFLVDAIGNDLSVCTLTKRKYKINGRVVGMKLQKTIIDNCNSVYGSPINNCFLIPDRFVTKK